jgi:predicted peptidase
MSMNRETAIVETIVQKHVELRYFEYLPAEYDSDTTRRWPLVIFLHGMGQRGSDLSLVNVNGLSSMAAAGSEFPFVLIAPQCPMGNFWDLMDDELEALLQHAIDTYRVDVSRLYLTGLSMGGFGTWGFATRHPQALAAIVPICGGGDFRRDFPEAVRTIRHVPVWAFHGADDDVVSPEMSSSLIDELKIAGATDVRLTVYEGVGHNCWERAYATDELFDWLLARVNTNFSL